METSITVRDSIAYVNNLPDEAREAVTKATSFKPEGYQYTKMYQMGRGDGSIKLFKNGKLPEGLVSRLTDELDKLELPYTVDVEPPSQDKPLLPDDYRLVGIEDRWYQDAAVEAALLHPRGVIRAPTGSGKTAIGARIVIERRRWALIVVPTIDLLHQYRRFLAKHIDSNDPIGQLGDGVVDPQPITVATVRTAAKAMDEPYVKNEYAEYDDKDDTTVNRGELREWIGRVGTLIVDEAHILGAQTVYGVSTKLPALNKYGMSASPWRDDGADLMIEAATGRVIYDIRTKVLVDEKFLVPPRIRVVPTKSWWRALPWGQTCTRCDRQRERNKNNRYVRMCVCGSTTFRSEFGEAYKHEISENPIRNQRIAEIVQTLHGPTLVLVKHVKHGKDFEKLMPGAMFMSGRDVGSERERVFDLMRNGELRVLIATTIADLGLDLPILQNLVLAGGGKSSTRHLQRIGRVVRAYPGKKYATVIDFDDAHVHRWFADQAAARRKIEKAEWAESGLWT